MTPPGDRLGRGGAVAFSVPVTAALLPLVVIAVLSAAVFALIVILVVGVVVVVISVRVRSHRSHDPVQLTHEVLVVVIVGPVEGDGVIVAVVVIVVVVPLVVHVIIVLAIYILDVLGTQAADVVEAHHRLLVGRRVGVQGVLDDGDLEVVLGRAEVDHGPSGLERGNARVVRCVQRLEGGLELVAVLVLLLEADGVHDLARVREDRLALV